MKLKEVQLTHNKITNWKDYATRPAREDDFETLLTESCKLMEGEKLIGVYIVMPKDKQNELLRQVVR